eukprot:6942286-Prymnesium_polylepis.1
MIPLWGFRRRPAASRLTCLGAYSALGLDVHTVPAPSQSTSAANTHPRCRRPQMVPAASRHAKCSREF